MQQYYRGFSLLESLILLLVLSISMLGLGQLQVRLWVKAGSLHTLDEAYLLAVNLIEINEINSLFSLNSRNRSHIPADRHVINIPSGIICSFST